MIRYRPLIGVTTQTLHAIDGIPENLPQSVVMNQRYYTAITLVGAVPVLVPLLDDDVDTLREIYDRLDGVLIPGGVDLDPRHYGEPPHPLLGRIDPARDRTELQLTKWCIADRKPMLGLCRGVQILNVAMGGTLWQDLGEQLPTPIKHDCFPTYGYERDHLAHEVSFTTGSRLRWAMEVEHAPVNSMHHQAIRVLGDGLRIAATAPDGVVEAVELDDDAFVVGVQWHPEVFELTDPHTRHVFREFVLAASRQGATAAR